MKTRDAAAKGGLAAAACVACCAPPIIAALGVTAGIAATAVVFLGLGAAIAVLLLGGAWIAARRRPATSTPAEPVSVAAPTQRIEQ